MFPRWGSAVRANAAKKAAGDRLTRTLKLEITLEEQLRKIEKLRKENHIYDSVLLTFRGYRESEPR
jgi:hypothetical protein